MKAKETLVLLVLAILLVGAAVWFSKREQTMTEQAIPPSKKVMDGLTSNTVERIEIAPPEQTSVVLTKRNAVWYTNPDKGYRADKNLVQGLFTAVEKPITGEVVSESPENFGDYDVNETSATRVRFYGSEGKLLDDLYVGKAGPQTFSTFVRQAGQNDVVNANASLAYVFNKPEGWRDKAIFDFPSDAITAVSAEGTSSTFSVRKSDGAWKMEKPAGREVQSTKFQPVLSNIASLRATDFVETSAGQSLAEFGLDPAMEKLSVTYEDRSTSPAKPVNVVLLAGKTKPGTAMVYVKRADSETVATISQYSVETMIPKPEDLAVAPPAAPAAKETTATQQAGSATTASAVSSTPAPEAKPSPTPEEKQAVTTAAAETSTSATPAVTPAATPAATPAPTPAQAAAETSPAKSQSAAAETSATK